MNPGNGRAAPERPISRTRIWKVPAHRIATVTLIVIGTSAWTGIDDVSHVYEILGRHVPNKLRNRIKGYGWLSVDSERIRSVPTNVQQNVDMVFGLVGIGPVWRARWYRPTADFEILQRWFMWHERNAFMFASPMAR